MTNLKFGPWERGRLERYRASPFWERDTSIVAARRAGATFASIAKQHGLSSTRIRAIYYKLNRLLRAEAAAEAVAPVTDGDLKSMPAGRDL